MCIRDRAQAVFNFLIREKAHSTQNFSIVYNGAWVSYVDINLSPDLSIVGFPIYLRLVHKYRLHFQSDSNIEG